MSGMRRFTERMFQRQRVNAKAVEALFAQLDLGIKAVRLG